MIAQTSAIVGKIANYGSWASVSVETQHGRYHVCALRPQEQNVNGHWFHITAKKTSAIWCVEAGYGFGRPKNILASGMTFRDAVAWCEHANDPAPEPTRAERYQEWVNNGGGIDALVTPRDPGPCIGDDDTDLSRVTTPDPEPTPTPAAATTIDIASKYGTFTYQMVAWRCADRGNGGIASYPTWRETLDAHEWIDDRPLTTDRIKRVVTTWPAQNIATVELDNGYWYQVRYETMPAPDYAAIPAIGGGSHEADIFTAKLDNGTIIATGDHATVDDAALHYVSGPLVQLTPGGHWQASYVKRGIRCSVYAPDGTRLARYFNAWQAEDTGMVYGPAFAPTPNATIPAIGGGSHEADTTPEPEYIVSLTSGNEVSLVTRNGGVIHWKHLSDAIQSARNLMHTDNGRAYTGYAVIEMPANATVAQWSVNDSYADLPPIGGGSHEAATQPTKPRNVATSQKRDNQRAARAALNEAYKAHAATHAPELSDILAEMGFTIVEQLERGETPVTIWQSADATIKQTPYTVRVYNGTPKRLPRHGDAEIINSVEAGWIMRSQPTGYAAGIADAILRLIEVPDPYMQALDAMEAREAEQSAPLPRPSAADLAEMYGSVDLDLTARLLQAGERDAYTIAAPGHDGRPVIIAEVEHHDIPNPILIGGQPSMSGPWQVPVMSGGSQDAPNTATCYRCGMVETDQWTQQGACCDACYAELQHKRESFLASLQPPTADDYCVRGCERPATQWVYSHGNYLAYCDECAPCQHDADEPPARFCSQCGHDAQPDAPQPTDTGASHAVTMPSDPEPTSAAELADMALAANPFDLDLARRAHTWSSFEPERRAAYEGQAYHDCVHRIAADLWTIAETTEQRTILRDRFLPFVAQYRTRHNAILSARSRTASTMITGAAKFNHRRNQKAIDTETRRERDMQEWYTKAEKQLRAAILDARTDDQRNDDEFQRLAREIDRSIEIVKQIETNTGRFAGFNKRAFTSGITGYIERAHKNGQTEIVKRALAYLDQAQQTAGVVGITKRHRIWKLA